MTEYSAIFATFSILRYHFSAAHLLFHTPSVVSTTTHPASQQNAAANT